MGNNEEDRTVSKGVHTRFTHTHTHIKVVQEREERPTVEVALLLRHNHAQSLQCCMMRRLQLVQWERGCVDEVLCATAVNGLGRALVSLQTKEAPPLQNKPKRNGGTRK